MIPYDAMAVDAGFTDLGPVTEEFALSTVCVKLPAERVMLSAFLSALADATQWFRDHVEESAALAAARTRTEPRYALGACQALAAAGVIPPDQRAAPAALGAAVEALRANGQVPPDGPDPLEAAVDYSYL
jgi:ABC-type nitrate/sulfonate/bicarbonate transport system substrate-binding protein